MGPAVTLLQLGDLSFMTCIKAEVVCRQESPFSVAVVVPDVLAVMPCLLMASALLGLVCTPETEASSWLKAKAAATASSCSLSYLGRSATSWEARQDIWYLGSSCVLVSSGAGCNSTASPYLTRLFWVCIIGCSSCARRHKHCFVCHSRFPGF
jgi:hypothetical protein